jgi:predicted RNA-binding Zn ribbon-like protein
MPNRSQPAPSRFALEPAPGGLRLVQDLVNTSLSAHQGDPARDDLADVPPADRWLREALTAWSAATGGQAPDLSLQPEDLAPLRQVREQLRQSLRASAVHVDAERPPGTAVPASADVRLTMHPDGHFGYLPLAAGWLGVTGLISIEMLLAQATGTRGRLKTCAAPACGACFYDGSPNRARVWHDTRMCGNVPNLRASRARRKADGS